MTEGNVVGSAEFELRATRQKLGQDIKAAERDLDVFVDRAEKKANTGAGNIGSGIEKMTRAATAGVLALTAVLAAAATFAFQAGQASLKMADDMANSARRIGIGTTALQEWRYVARKTGEDAAAVDADLEKFATKFAQAQAGISKEAAKPFARLLFDQNDLRQMKDADEALEKVMDRIGALKSPNDRQAIAEQFGLGSLATAAREGAEEVDRLRGEAAALGYVMDAEIIQKGADAQGQLEDLSQVIGIQMAEAFINLSDEVLNFTSQIADAINALSDFIDKSRVAKRISGVGFGDALGMAASPMGLVKGLVKIGRFAINGPNLVNSDALEDLASGTGRYAPPRTPRRLSTGGSPNLAALPGRTNNDAQRAAEREARRAERVEQEIFRLRQRALGIADEELMTVQERFDLAKKQVEMEREAEAKELESRLARKDITQAEFDQLKLIQTQTATLEDRVSSDILARDLADERLAKERALTDLTADLLSLQSSAARTAKERREIELRLLAMAQQRAREDLERDLSRDPNLSDADKQARRDALGQVQAAQSAAVNRQTMSPLEVWRDQSLKTADEIAEAYENVAARGLDALNDGIVDAIMNSKSLGEVFSNVAKQILADLTSIAVRRSITEPLADMLFGGNSAGGGAKSIAQAAKGGGSSNWLSTAFKMGRSFFGFSGGGYTGDGGVLEPAGIVHKGEFVLPQHAVSRIGLPKLEAMRLGALPGFSAGGLVGGGSIPGAAPRQSGPVVFDMRGAFVPEAFMREVEQKVSAGEARMRGEVPGLAVSAVRDAQDRYAF
ncbi:hypothetical protein [Brevundimonas bullata]|uniref:hypothetical protein n=1 Tax=Brevundimonas bullata TaxID=13160 RepID=UPI002FD93EAE